MQPPPPRSEGSNPSLSAPTQSPDSRDQRDQKTPESHDSRWEKGFVTPIAKVMKERGVQSLRITITEKGKAQYVLDPVSPKAPKWEVGAPYIFPMDRPAGYWCVVVTHESGIAHYLSIHGGRRWPHALNLANLGTSRAVPLAEYGVQVTREDAGLRFEQVQPSSAVYADGKPQRWQPLFPGREFIPFAAPSPNSWRFDPKVLPKLLAWIDKNPNQIKP